MSDIVWATCSACDQHTRVNKKHGTCGSCRDEAKARDREDELRSQVTTLTASLDAARVERDEANRQRNGALEALVPVASERNELRALVIEVLSDLKAHGRVRYAAEQRLRTALGSPPVASEVMERPYFVDVEPTPPVEEAKGEKKAPTSTEMAALLEHHPEKCHDEPCAKCAKVWPTWEALGYPPAWDERRRAHPEPREGAEAMKTRTPEPFSSRWDGETDMGVVTVEGREFLVWGSDVDPLFDLIFSLCQRAEKAERSLKDIATLAHDRAYP